MTPRNASYALLALTLIATLTACPPDGDTNNPPTPDNDHTHAYSTTWKSNETQHWHECACGEKSDLDNHTYNADGPCTACNHNQPPHTHAYTWESNETQHWQKCTYGETTTPANHAWGDWEQTKAPTATQAGEKERACPTCQKTQTQPIDKLPACECPNGTYHDKGDPCCEGVNCECETVYGYLEMVDEWGTPVGKAPILKGTGYTGEMDAFIANVQTGYNGIGDGNKEVLIDKIKEIRVVSSTGSNDIKKGADGKYVITFPEHRTETQIRNQLNQWVNNGTIQ
jgi:hypothetical protein